MPCNILKSPSIYSIVKMLQREREKKFFSFPLLHTHRMLFTQHIAKKINFSLFILSIFVVQCVEGAFKMSHGTLRKSAWLASSKKSKLFWRNCNYFQVFGVSFVFHPPPLPTNCGYWCYPPIWPNKRVGVKDRIWVLDSRSFFWGPGPDLGLQSE